jgi:tRNA(Ile)-lysidine synthetase-like protein
MGAAVAWSGGADSTALLLALHSRGLQPVAWHVDHAWHHDSALHTRWLEQRARNWGIPFFSCRLKERPERNREAVARWARYELFHRWSDEQGVRVLCLGHHLDDQAETVFLRLLQGAGVSGCQGMKPIRSMGDLTLIRPLLSVPKHDLETALLRAGVDWLKDPSNQDLSLRRNHVRYVVFPRMRQAGIEPRDLFSRLSRQAMNLSDHIQQMVDRMEVECCDDLVSVDWDEWARQTPCVRARLLQRLTALLLGEARVPGRRHIQLVERWLRHGGHGGLDLSCSRLYRKNRRLYLEKRENPDAR